MANPSSASNPRMTNLAAKPPPLTDGPYRLRLAGAMTVSLVVHALIISLQFGLPGIGLPALDLPWRERRAQSVDLQVVLAPPASGAGAESAPPSPPPSAGNTPPAGLRLVPMPRTPDAGTKPRKSKPAAPRASRPRVKRETPVIALNDTRNSRFNMPAPTPDEVLPPTEQVAEPPAAPPEEDVAAREHEQAALRQAEEEKALRAREAEELAAQQQQQAEAARRQEEETVRLRAEQVQRQEEARQREEAQRLALEEQRKAEEADRQAAALALQRQREETQHREREEASRRALELEEKQRAEALRLQEERARREAMELQAKKQAEAAEAARQQAAARERERQAEELAARKKAETEGAAPRRDRDPELVLGDNPAPGARIDALPRDLGGGLAGRALEQARRGEVLRNDVPVARDTGNAAEQPRRRSFLGGKDVDVGVMMYVESWRLKIERNGSIMYPRAAVDKAQGDPVVTVAVRSDGSVENVVIHRSSGRPELDEAVHRIVRVNARYSAFPPELARRFDVIEIRKVWNFDDRLRILEEVR